MRGYVLSDWARFVAVCALAAATSAPLWAQSIYTCVDRHGRRLTADRPIPECSDREQNELTSSGTVKNKLGPMLSDYERAAIEERKRKEAEERNKVVEQERRDRVLLARYPDKHAHDTERASAIVMVTDVQEIAEKRIADLKQERKTVNVELATYKSKPDTIPFRLRRRITEIGEDIKIQERFLYKQLQEKDRINQRFDEELGRLQGLWTKQRQQEQVNKNDGATFR